jgi:chromosome segregation ATPase
MGFMSVLKSIGKVAKVGAKKVGKYAADHPEETLHLMERGKDAIARRRSAQATDKDLVETEQEGFEFDGKISALEQNVKELEAKIGVVEQKTAELYDRMEKQYQLLYQEIERVKLEIETARKKARRNFILITVLGFLGIAAAIVLAILL